VSNDGQSSDSDDSDDDGRSDQPPSAVVDPQAEMCEVCLIECLRDPANVQQTSSKCIQNTPELLDVCWIV